MLSPLYVLGKTVPVPQLPDDQVDPEGAARYKMQCEARAVRDKSLKARAQTPRGISKVS